MSLSLLTQNIILEDDKVILRTLTIEDAEHLYYFAENEPDIFYYSLVRPIGKEAMKKYIEETIAMKDKGLEHAFVVFDKIRNAYAGCTRFYDIQHTFNTLQLGYTWYGKNFQHTYVNTHCKYLLLSLAFEKLLVDRVEFRADNNNAKSIAAMLRIGCSVEGVLRSNMPSPYGNRRDSIILSILKDEWFNEVKKNLAEKL